VLGEPDVKPVDGASNRFVVEGRFTEDVARLGPTSTLWVATRSEGDGGPNAKDPEESLYWPRMPCTIIEGEGEEARFSCEVELRDAEKDLVALQDCDAGAFRHWLWIAAVPQEGLAELADRDSPQHCPDPEVRSCNDIHPDGAEFLNAFTGNAPYVRQQLPA
jgi:hypothetical protein